MLKSQPITLQIYELLIQFTLRIPTYRWKRLRLALCVLFVTAIRIKDLLFLKVYQLQPLITEYSILIEDFKQNTNSYKAVLTEKGKKII